MTECFSVSLHELGMGFRTDRRDFARFALSYLKPLVGQKSAKPSIEVSLEWDEGLAPNERSGLEQLGRRVWAGKNRLQYAEVWQVPGLQMDLGWQGTLAVRAAYSWPALRAKWLSRVMAPSRQRLFVSLIYYLVYFPCAWWLERERGWTLVHASAITGPEGGLVLSGLPGGGKTTAVLAALEMPGWKIVSDNLLFTDGRRVYACPEPVHTDATTRSLLGDSTEHLVPTGRRFSHRRQDYEVADQARQMDAKPRALGFLRLGEETAVQPLDPDAAARRLLANDCLAKELMAYQESAAAMHQVWPSVGDLRQRWSNTESLARAVSCYDVTIARDAPVTEAMQHVIQELWDAS